MSIMIRSIGVGIAAALAAFVVVQAGRSIAADSADQVAAVQEFIDVLPEDGGSWHVSLMLSPNWRSNAIEVQTYNWFVTDVNLAALKAQTHWHIYTTDSAIFKARFEKAIGTATPMLLITDENGGVVYLGTRASTRTTSDTLYTPEQMPDSPSRLLPILRARFHNFCTPRPPVPEPKPPEPPEPVPSVPPAVPVVGPPDLGQNNAEGNPWGLLVVAAIGAALITAFISFRHDM